MRTYGKVLLRHPLEDALLTGYGYVGQAVEDGASGLCLVPRFCSCIGVEVFSEPGRYRGVR